MREFKSLKELLNCPHAKKAIETGGANWGKQEEWFYGRELQQTFICHLCDQEESS